MVVVDKLTKETHFIAVRTTYSEANITNIFMREVSQLHGITKVIVSDRDSKSLENFGKDYLKDSV